MAWMKINATTSTDNSYEGFNIWFVVFNRLCILISHDLLCGVFLHMWENLRNIYLFVGLVFSNLEGEEKFP